MTGVEIEYAAVFGDSISSIDDLDNSTKSPRILHQSYVYKLLIGYFNGNYPAAEKASEVAWTFPIAKKPEILFIYHTIFDGLVALRLYRDVGDDKRLKRGGEMMDRLRKWSYHSMAQFSNKWLLLKAEYTASFHDSSNASQLYEASIKAALDCGNIHEAALAYNLYGDYHAAHGKDVESKISHNMALKYYMQWGASAIAEKLQHKHNLDLAIDGGDCQFPPDMTSNMKRKNR